MSSVVHVFYLVHRSPPDTLHSRIYTQVSDMLASVLRLLPIFEGVPEEKVPLLARLFHFEVFKEGDIVIKYVTLLFSSLHLHVLTPTLFPYTGRVTLEISSTS